MCNDYEQHIAWAQYQRLMQEIALEIPGQQNELNLPRADDVRIGDEGPVKRRCGDAVELTSMRFGFAPARPKAGRSSTSDPKAAAANADRPAWGVDIARRNLTAADSVCTFSTRQARDVRVQPLPKPKRPRLPAKGIVAAGTSARNPPRCPIGQWQSPGWCE
jgi:hypothetical protein